MAKRYDPIMCMLVDEPTKAQDAEKLHYYQHSYTKKWYVVSPDGKVFKEFNTEAEAKNYVNGKAQDSKDSAKAKDKLVKVPDSKLKDFEASLRSAGFKVVSKSDRGKTTHYQVEVSSSKKFTEADLREWANKIDAVCDKMESVAPTTWNIGLTVDGKITAGLDVREMYVKDSASALDEAIKAADAKVHDSVDIEHIADYLWTWASGRDTARELFNEGLDKYSGPHDPEHKKEAYEFARKYATSELNKVYSKLKSVVEKRLKEGFETNKRLIDSYK